MGRIRVRRPLIALVALLIAIVVGYAVRAATRDDDGSPGPSTPASTHSQSAAVRNLPLAPEVVVLTRTLNRKD